MDKVNYTKIPKDSWAIIERVLMRYPEQKEEYDNMRLQLLESTPYNDGQPRGNCPGNRLEDTVIKLHSPRMQRIEREIRAVENAYNALSGEQKEVIRTRYWTLRWRKVPYAEMRCCYSEGQMKRIVYRVIDSVGRELGEII